MRIIITTPTEADPKDVFDYFDMKCLDALESLKEVEIEIEGTDLKKKRKLEA